MPRDNISDLKIYRVRDFYFIYYLFIYLLYTTYRDIISMSYSTSRSDIIVSGSLLNYKIVMSRGVYPPPLSGVRNPPLHLPPSLLPYPFSIPIPSLRSRPLYPANESG